MGIDDHFDDAAILAMCLAFDRIGRRLQACGEAATVQEIVAIRMIEPPCKASVIRTGSTTTL